MGPEPKSCLGCGLDLGPGLLACPACRRLVHAERLSELSAEAQAAEAREDWAAALASWRDALDQLPATTRQHATIAARLAELGVKADTSPARPRPADDGAGGWSTGAAAGGLGALAMLAFKFKFLLFALLTKGKLLLLGLTKGGTVLTMFAAAGAYWTRYGLPFAIGLVLSVYVHEMGHVFALRRYGARASAPMFIPGLGAVVRLQQSIYDARQDARVGLAGPIWGLAASLACVALFAIDGRPIWAALASFGALINLFNLIPIWQLDGGRAFRSMNRPERWLAVAALATAWVITDDGIVGLLMVVGAVRALVDRPAERSDPGAVAWYIFLIAALSALAFSPYLLAVAKA